MASTRKSRRAWGLGAGVVVLAAVFVTSLAGTGAAASKHIHFRMVRSSGAVTAGCIPHARARVTITSQGSVEVMRVHARRLPKNMEFDVFVIQVPNAPFGMSWYQGDFETNDHGRADAVFIGRFNTETFVVAPGTAPAPVVHDQPPFPDASTNPATGPVHMFHLGLWFDSPVDAATAGCGDTVTPFNGDHHAGVQALSTRNFGDLTGPLSFLKP
jgi:hypothetical protein